MFVASIFLINKLFFGGIKFSCHFAEFVSLILITYFLYKRDSSWKDIGLRIPQKKITASFYFILYIVSIGLIFNFLIQPLLPNGVNEINDGKVLFFNEMLFQLIFIGIGTAAIGEEMLMKGFVINNLTKISGQYFFAISSAVLIQAFLFAILFNGTQGMVSAGVIRLILGIFYLLVGRNYLVVKAAHAVPDLISITSSYQNQ